MSPVADIVKAPVIEFLPYQKADIESSSRFTWSCWSRQVGKSFGKSFKRLTRALAYRRNQVLLSAGARQSRELMEKVRQHVRALNVASDYFSFEELIGGTTYSVERIELPGNLRIFALPANPDTARGYTGDVFLDEFGIHRDSREIWGAMFPTVARVNGEIDVASTPKGKQGMFYELRSNPTFAHNVVTIEDAVRDGLKIDIAALRAGLGDDELFRQEFMCEFLDEGLAFLTYEQIVRCEDPELPGPVKIGPDDDALGLIEEILERLRAGGEFYAGMDIGRRKDLTVFWIWERVGTQLITRGVIEMSNRTFHDQYAVLSAIMKCPGAKGLSIDETGLGMAIAEAAEQDFGAWRIDKVNFSRSTTNAKGDNVPVKQKLAEQFRIRVQDATVTIPGAESIRNDWHSIQRAVTTGGTIRYRAESTPDGHADRFWAAALGVDAATMASGPMEYVGSDRKLAFSRAGIW